MKRPSGRALGAVVAAATLIGLAAGEVFIGVQLTSIQKMIKDQAPLGDADGYSGETLDRTYGAAKAASESAAQASSAAEAALEQSVAARSAAEQARDAARDAESAANVRY